MKIRPMRPDDLSKVRSLCESLHWSYTHADLARLLVLQPDGCFCAEDQGRHVGQALGLVMGHEGAIGVVGVQEHGRRQGLGGALTRAVLTFLLDSGATQVKLDATDMGIGVYRELGFEPVCAIHHYSRHVPALAADDPPVRSITPPLADVVLLDARAYGQGRRPVLEALAVDSDLVGVTRDGETAGYCMIRPTSEPDGLWVGPMVALDEEAGLSLTRHVLARCAGRLVRIGVPDLNPAAWRFLEEEGFARDFTLTRMYYGDQAPRETLSLVWAEAGHEKG